MSEKMKCGKVYLCTQLFTFVDNENCTENNEKRLARRKGGSYVRTVRMSFHAPSA